MRVSQFIVGIFFTLVIVRFKQICSEVDPRNCKLLGEEPGRITKLRRFDSCHGSEAVSLMEDRILCGGVAGLLPRTVRYGIAMSAGGGRGGAWGGGERLIRRKCSSYLYIPVYFFFFYFRFLRIDLILSDFTEFKESTALDLT